MLRTKLAKYGASGMCRVPGIVVIACLIVGWSRPACSAETSDASDEKPHLQLAPIFFSNSIGGVVNYMYLINGYGSTKSTGQSIMVGVTDSMRIKSYFWQPWFSQINSSLMFNVTDTRTSGSSTDTSNSIGTYVNGDVWLNLVKESRFPFEVRAYKHDSSTRTGSSLYDTSFVSQITGYNLSQQYKTLNRRLVAGVIFMGNKTSGPTITPDYSHAASMDLQWQATRTQTITVTGDVSNENQPALGKTREFGTLVANHFYRPGTTFSLASVANLIKQHSRDSQVTGPDLQSDARSAQFTSFASLRPERSPLSMTAAVRLFTFKTDDGNAINTTRESNFNFGANYLFSALIRLYGSVNVADSLGTQTITTSGSLVANKDYRSSTNIGGFIYSGTIGGSLGFDDVTINSANSSTSTKTQHLALHLGHALDKVNQFGGGQLLRNLNQTIQTSISNGGSSSSSIGTGGSLTWVQSEGGGTTQLRLGANDSRSLSGQTQIFDMINLAATRSEAISRNESMSGDLSIQATQSKILGADGAYNTSQTITPSANIRYINMRTFMVPRLRFDSLLHISDTNIAPTQNLSLQNQSSRTWDNNFDYQVGLTSVQLRTHLEENHNITSYAATFVISRSF